MEFKNNSNSNCEIVANDNAKANGQALKWRSKSANISEQHGDEAAAATVEAAKREQPIQEQQEPKQQTGSDEQPSSLKRIILDGLLFLVKLVMAFYDLVSQPVYYFYHEVHKRQRELERTVRGVQKDPNDPLSPWLQVHIDQRQHDIAAKIDTFCTYDELMCSSITKFGDRPCYAYRRVLHERWSKRPDGSEKLNRRLKLSGYHWVTFAQFERQISAARRGFLLVGVCAGQRVMLYADTRPEWQIASHALIRLGAVVVTMYATLGIEGVEHSINESEASLIVVQQDKVARLLTLKPKLPKLKRIIFLDGSLGEEVDKAAEEATESDDGTNANGSNEPPLSSYFEHPEVDCTSFGQLLLCGRNAADQAKLVSLEEQNQEMCTGRSKDSVAVIMYTSGSTGVPKGTLISHRNILAAIKAFSYVGDEFVFEPDKHVHAAYLPLAHIFEFCFEALVLFHGLPYGFATPQTLTDKSPGLMAGQRGDLTLLKPTILIVVPLILDRIVQGIKQGIRGQSYFKRHLLDHLLYYKMRWQRRHYETPLVDKIVCSKLGIALGGRARYAICGSAPLAGETQIFARAALNLKLPQGFGTTETCAATSCQRFGDQTTTNVGLPVYGSQIKLEPWEEGNYRPTDKPNPRGEIVVGGEMISRGYFKLPEQTAENFYVDAAGILWYRTGDIGEFLPGGLLRIIDRKKDLVKLQNGEYISLGKVESTLKSNPYTENFCVYASSAHNYVVALGPANELGLRSLAKNILEELKATKDQQRIALLSQQSEQQDVEELAKLLADYESSEASQNCVRSSNRLERLCANKLIRERVLASLVKLAKERKLAGPEVPRKFLLLADEWTEDKNLVTAAMKIRRNYIYKRYDREVGQLYEAAN